MAGSVGIRNEAYKAAFKRGQNGQPWSFPRFRSKARFRSFGLLSWSGARIEAGRIVIKGLGALRLHLHRAAPENGDILGCTLTKRGRGWTVQLQIRTSPADPILECGFQKPPDSVFGKSRTWISLSPGQRFH